MSEEQLRQMNDQIEEANKLLDRADDFIIPDPSDPNYRSKIRWEIKYQEYLKTFKIK